MRSRRLAKSLKAAYAPVVSRANLATRSFGSLAGTVSIERRK